MDSKKSKIKRRDFILLASSVTLGVTSDLISGSIKPIVRMAKKYIIDSEPKSYEFTEMFVEWDTFNLDPGKSHPLFGLEHPDITIAENELVNKITPPDATYEYYKNRHYEKNEDNNNKIIIGGPVSNAKSRIIRKFEKHPETGMFYLPDGPEKQFRWEFHYPVFDGKSPKPSRYLNNQKYSSLPKCILDLNNPAKIKEYRAKLDSDDFMYNDYLLITYIPNTLTENSKNYTVLDIADLHGVGDQAFVKIISEEGLLKEFYAETFKRRYSYFQLLYEVPVTHNHKEKVSYPGYPKLRGVHQI